jgi:uncharacterized membrane protein
VTWYDFVKFLHIGCAVMWVGGAAMMQFFALRALAARSGERLVNFAEDVECIGFRVLTPFSAGAFLSGLGLVWDSSFWSLSNDWILIGLGLFAFTFLMGVLFFGPESGRVGRLISAEGPESPAVQTRIKRLIVLTRIDLVVLLLIIFDMVVKPSFSDGWTIAGALIAAAVLSALLVAPGLRSGTATAATE